MLRTATLLKKRLWYRCFPVNFAKFPRTPFLQNTSGRLLLQEVEFSSANKNEYTNEEEENSFVTNSLLMLQQAQNNQYKTRKQQISQ